MLRNYFLVALRHFINRRDTALLNLIGLAIALGSALFILIYVRYERSFDQHIPRADRTYRVLTIDEALGVTSNLVGITLPALGEAMQQDLAGVEKTVRMNHWGRLLMAHGDKQLYTEQAKRAEASIFEVFDLQLAEGDVKQALTQPRTAVMSSELAEKMFGSPAEALGKRLEINRNNEVEVTGVLAPPAGQSHLQFDLLLAMVPAVDDSLTAQMLQSWGQISMVTYARLSPGARETEIEAELEALIRSHDVADNFSVTLQPLAEAHLGSSDILFDGHNQHKTDRRYVNALSLVAIFILLIAVFNFMNLATARATRRALEVGMRKVLGAQRRQLIFQFLTESVLMSLLGLVLAIGLMALSQEWVDLPMDEAVLGQLFGDGPLLLGMVGGTMLLGLLAGSYPALLLSGFPPIAVLKQRMFGSKSGLWMRRVLVVLQFSASIAMIAGTVIVYQQLSLIRSADKGFNEAQVLLLRLGDRELRERYEALRNELQSLPGIAGVASTSSMPGEGFGRNGLQPEGMPEDDAWIVSVMGMDEHFVPLMEMEVVEGRNFSPDFGTDSVQSVLVNQALVKALGWEDDPIGKWAHRSANFNLRIAGVVEDFYFANMRHQIEPLMMFYQPGANGTVALKLRTEDLKATLTGIESVWEKVNPQHPFEYSFFDQDFAQQYRSDEQFARLMLFFTWLAIFIACLGLLGLSAYMAEQRTKEIGLRKVLGATVPQLMGLLSREFTILVAIAAGVAVLLSYRVLQEWLEAFAYRVSLGVEVYLLAGGGALLIALLTNAWHALRTARANPVKALRYE